MGTMWKMVKTCHNHVWSPCLEEQASEFTSDIQWFFLSGTIGYHFLVGSTNLQLTYILWKIIQPQLTDLQLTYSWSTSLGKSSNPSRILGMPGRWSPFLPRDSLRRTGSASWWRLSLNKGAKFPQITRVDWVGVVQLPSGELTFCHGKSPCFMGKSTISVAIFNCYVSSPEGIQWYIQLYLVDWR